MIVESKGCGTVEVQESQIITFRYGLFGFEEYNTFALLDSGTPPFFWLQSLDEKDVAFIVLIPERILPDYYPEVTVEELSAIELTGSADENALLLAIVTVREEGMTMNLQGPLYINKSARLGLQCLSRNDAHLLRYPVNGYEKDGSE